MELINATRMSAGYNLYLEPSGREVLVVVAKGTFSFPQAGDPTGALALHDTQLPLVMADTFTGKPGFSAPVYEVDFAPRKPQAEVLLLGSAYAPNGEAASRVNVGLRVGGWHKAFAVVGERHWDSSLSSLRATTAAAFASSPISYDVAFGGTDIRHDDPAQHAACMDNPVGIGFHKHLKAAWIDGAPLPRTEETERKVVSPQDDYRPMAFGPIGRGWASRARHAGTYDDTWLADHFPFLPPDFDERYFQAAPSDQQLPLDTFAQGPQEVVLLNLTPEGTTRFTIPQLNAPMQVFPKTGGSESLNAVLDTVVIEPDLQRFTLTWRASRPLRHGLRDIRQVRVGRSSAAASV